MKTERTKYFKVLDNNMKNSYSDGKLPENKDSYKTIQFIQQLGGDTPKNRILEYFIAKKRTNVTPGKLQEAIPLEKQDLQKILNDLLKENILNNGHLDIYELNIKNPAVEKLLENYFFGGIKKIGQEYENKRIDYNDADTAIESLDDILLELRKEIKMPDEEEFDFEDEFAKIYMQLYMWCEEEREHHIKELKEKGII